MRTHVALLRGINVAANPYPQETSPRCLHAVFRRQEMTPDEIAAVAAAQQRASDKGSRDQATAVGSTLFLRNPDGMGRSELAAQLGRSVTRTLADQLADQAITLNTINPGRVDTGYASPEDHEAVRRRFPQGRWGTPRRPSPPHRLAGHRRSRLDYRADHHGEGGFRR